MEDRSREVHRFASERHMYENRVFWTRVAALLLANSFLVAGFASLYGSENPNDTLLLAIAAAGIALQALWPIFGVMSYVPDRYWRRLMLEIETNQYPELECTKAKENLELRVKGVRTCYEAYFKRYLKFDYMGGGTALSVFFVAFLAIWIVATSMVAVSIVDVWQVWRVLTVVLPSLGVIIVSSVCICIWMRARDAHAKSIR